MTDHHREAHHAEDDWQSIGELTAAIREEVDRRRRWLREGEETSRREERPDAALEASIGK